MFVKPDIVLLHPPSVYDFRDTLTVPSPIADLIPSGPTFEMYPVGFSYLGDYLERNGFDVRVVNLAARMLESRRFDVPKFLSGLRPAAFGVSFHWLPHAHGAVEVARLCKRLHPDIPVVMGGYSATIFRDELMEFPEIDFVLGGDSTEEPLLMLMRSLTGKSGPPLDSIPNLTRRDPASGLPIDSRLTYVPCDLDHLGDNYVYMLRSALKYGDLRGLRAFRDWWSYPLTAVMTCRGCSRDCSFCGGSASSMDSRFSRTCVAYATPERIARDVETVSGFTGAPIFVVGDLRQKGDGHAAAVLERIGRRPPANHVVLELFEPAPRWFFELASRNLINWDIEISPESHDVAVRRGAGKYYSNEALEDSLGWALEAGCGKVDVFFMIGLPGQTPESVRDTVRYCAGLLERYGTRVNPLIGPLAPFLDPGCALYENAERLGYNLRFHTLADYRKALLEPHWRDMLSYETRWMSRQDIVDSTYESMLELTRAKLASGRISVRLARETEMFVRDSVHLLERLDGAMGRPDGPVRAGELDTIRRDADSLHEWSSVVKGELAWPVVGSRFRFLNIMRLIIGSYRGVRRVRRDFE